jgi:glycosyltransferase involved in cell wall biosynthesis
VDYHFIGQTRRRIMPNMFRGVGQIAERLALIGPDLVHAHGPSFAVAALRAGFSPIWTIHGVLAQEAANYSGTFNRAAFLLAAHYERIALARVRHITSVSKYVAEAYRCRTSAPILVIDNPAPPECFALERRPAPGRILMPASVIPLKDPLTLIRAVALLIGDYPQLRVRLAGSVSDDPYVKMLRGEIHRLGVEDAVDITGLLHRAALLQEYAGAEAVVLPSRQEVAPMAVIEAMAAGVPVIASSAGGLPYLVEHGVTGFLFPVGDERALAEAMREVLQDRDRASQMGLAARKVAAHRFRRDEVAARYLELYRAAVQSHV